MTYTFTTAPNVSTGTGTTVVTTADVNGDGKLDMLTANANTVSVRLGTGNGTFTSSSEITVGADTKALAVADVNGDGKLDLLTVSGSTAAISVRLGAGDGTFTASADIRARAGSSAMAIVDVNNDGRPDLILTNPTQSSVDVQLGRGDGRFSANSNFATGSNPIAVTTADVNGDGKLDLLVTNQGSNTVSVKLSLAEAGKFKAGTDIATGMSPVSVTSADVNGDGKADLLIANRDSNSISVRLGRGDGTFASTSEVGVGAAPVSVMATDVDGDGKIDLVTANRGDDTVSVRFGAGNGTFSGVTTFAVGDQPTSVSTADVNGDGRIDLMVSNAGSNTVSVLLGAADPIPVVAVVSASGSGGVRKIGDVVTFTLFTDTPVTADGSPALTLSNGGTATFASQDDKGRLYFSYRVLEGQDTTDLQITGVDSMTGAIGSTGQTSFATKVDFAAGRGASDVATADINGDGKLDLVIANAVDSTVSILLGNGDGSFQAKPNIAAGGNSSDVTIADINRDGRLDLVTTNLSDHTVSLLLGNGDGGFQAKQDFATGLEPGSTAIADVNSDGKLDIVTANTGQYGSGNSVSVLLGDGRGRFQPKQDFVTDQGPTSVAIADVDGDGRADLVTSNIGAINSSNGNSVSILLGNGDGTFQNKQDVATALDPFSVSIADINGDGKLDLVTANVGSNSVSVLLGNGNGSFQAKHDFATGTDLRDLSIADINGDGRLDLVTANMGSNTVSVLLGNGHGGFRDKQDFTTGGGPTALSIADVDGDGKLDIAVVSGADNKVSVILNTSIAPRTLDGAGLPTVPGADTGRTIDATRPVLDKATAGGSTVMLTFSETLDAASGHTPAASAFTLTADGRPVTVAGVAMSGKTVTLTLATPLRDGQSLSVNYADPTSGDDIRALQDAAGNDAQSVARTIVVGTQAPTGLALGVADDTGISSSDRLTNDTDITVSGLGESGASVLLFNDRNGNGARDRGDILLGADTVGSDGRFSADIALDADGVYRIVAIQTGEAGRSLGSQPLSITLDTTAPGVTALAASGTGLSNGSGTLTVGKIVTLTVALSEAVTLVNAGNLSLGLSDGGTAKLDASASDATHLVFRHTVLVDQIASDLAVTGVLLNGARLTDAAGNDADLTGAIGNPAGTLIIDGLTGTKANETFHGTTGTDMFRGLGGNDTYYVDNLGDRVFEEANGGTDIVRSGVHFSLAGQAIENLLLTGTAAIRGTGNELANIISGNRNANTIDGGRGADILGGGAGKDSFVFSTPLGGDNIDRIKDFTVIDDTMRLGKSVFAGLAAGALAEMAFKILGTSAVDSSDRILYDKATGALFYDEDGSGSAVAIQFATLDTKVDVTHADFLIF